MSNVNHWWTLTLAAISVAALSGCLGTSGAGVDTATRADGSPAGALSEQDAQKSHVMQALLSRETMLKPGSSYDKVATSVLAANARAAEADLRAARLRAVAAEKNWLPTLGPSLSLNSMGDLVTSILVEQVLFDNGRKKAERAFTAADVEVAAVTLSEDTNQRVNTALGLYIAAEEARANLVVTRRALERMKHFEWIMSERVEGGVSDQSELSVLKHKRAELEADLSAQTLAEQTALAELSAMAATPVTGVSGLSEVHAPSAGRKPLSVLKAQAEMTRDVAAAKIDRAGYLPSVKATGNIGSNSSGPDLRVGSDQGLGFGTAAKLKALEATRDAASRRVAQAQEDAARERSRLDQTLASLLSRQSRQAKVTSEARHTYQLFEEQYAAGHRTVMEVVGVFENFTEAERKDVGILYQIAKARLQIGRQLGLLVNGAEI